MTRIIQTGTFSSLNKGDAAMQVVAHHFLKSTIRDSQIIIFAPHIELDRKFYRGSELFPCSRRKPLRALFLICRTLLWFLARRIYGTDLKILVKDQELLNYKHTDFVVDLSGDGLSEDFGIKCTLSHLVPIILSLLFEKPVILCAQTIGPFKLTKVLSRFVINKVDLITARDRATFDYLLQIGLNKPKIYLTSDLSLLLEPAAQDRIDDIFIKEGIETLGDPMVGICLSRIGVHPSERDFWENEMARVVDQIIEKLKIRVIFLSHVIGPGHHRDDRIVNRNVYHRLKNGEVSRLIEGDYSPQELKGVIGKFELFIGFRMHASISAVGMGVPTIAVSYSQKFLGFMESFGQGKWVLSIDGLKPEALGSKIEEAWAHREEIRKELMSNMEKMRERSLQNIKLVKMFLDQYKRNSL
jgi:colanic acid/amylovoran biosynthesis protein